MAMMFKRVAAAIQDAGLHAHPTDYLQVQRGPRGAWGC
jgi:hypothetical protein